MSNRTPSFGLYRKEFEKDSCGFGLIAQMDDKPSHVMRHGQNTSMWSAIDSVRNGEADAVLADKGYLTPIVEEDPNLMFLEQEELIGGGQGVGLRETDGELKAKFDAAIQSMKDDGSLNELIAKWEVSSLF